MGRNIFAAFLIFVVIFASTGCVLKNKQQEKLKEEQEKEMRARAAKQKKGKTPEQLRQDLYFDIAKKLDRKMNANPGEKRNYNILSKFYQDFNNDGRLDFVCVFEYMTNCGYIGNVWSPDITYGVAYALSVPDDMENYKQEIVYNVIPSVSDAKKTYGSPEKYAYSLISAATPRKDSFTLRFTDYYIDFGDEEVTAEYRDKNLESFWLEMTFEYFPEENDFRLAKYGGLNVYGEGERFFDFKESPVYPITLSGWRDWYLPMKFVTAENSLSKNQIKHVKNEAEFLAAIGSNTTIFIDVPSLNLTGDSIRSKVPANNKHIRTVDEEGNSSSIIFHSLENLAIIGNCHDEEPFVTLEVDEVTDEVLWIEDSRNITLQALHMTHNVPAGTCEGGVFKCRNSENLHVQICHFDGSGIVGIDLSEVRNASFMNSSFYNNSHHAISLYSSENVTFYMCGINENKTLFSVVESLYSSVRFGRGWISDNAVTQGNRPLINVDLYNYGSSNKEKKKYPAGYFEMFDVWVDGNDVYNDVFVELVKHRDISYSSSGESYRHSEKREYTDVNRGTVYYLELSPDTPMSDEP